MQSADISYQQTPCRGWMTFGTKEENPIKIYINLQKVTRVIAILFVLVSLRGTSLAQTTNQVAVNRVQGKKIVKVFLNLQGDPKLVHRFWTFLDFELEDSGLLHTNTPAEADAVISGEFSMQIAKVNLGFGLFRMHFVPAASATPWILARR
jgi:hypothetical protein